MAAADLSLALAFLVLAGALLPAEADIGVNWGMLSTHRLSPSIVIDLMKENRIGKVKLFDTDPAVLRALMGSNIEVMVGIPNEMLALLSSSPAAADVWVSQNVSRYVVKGGVNLRGSGESISRRDLLIFWAGQLGELVGSVTPLKNLDFLIINMLPYEIVVDFDVLGVSMEVRIIGKAIVDMLSQ
ncbi:glucan endo-1,3-beta-glucosidase 5-like [Phalaenopsis equestris]|uniref:glucan endo-1,3-beta-glucosidase 5-like n=1 Tax=Phalaenopsis equestris TaxID=78828 RepID=UPI0009E2C28E|nr:glucan endo-1,3-beta-glucosidase 5-like [Phalaenopsis equestris]